MTEASHEYLTFLLGDGEYGVDILCVQEIMVLTPTTEIPGVPDYIKGVINLRGVIVPIVDLRNRFGLREKPYDATTVVIVLRTQQAGRNVVLGIVVDAVSEVYKLSDADLKTAPDFGEAIDSRFIHSLAAIEDQIIVLLDTHKLLDVKELYKVTQRAVPAAELGGAA
ncbi:chemotaxis protein CheW [Simiduia sp. 21SJ11W-1]|uniref:chemotaxis protein CheW n=1 Tax=Simiduia sp. 21SJ11W-1 TaxID=2909669 RepID=UPI0020A1730A|nr:chemotaxis protein CheW [Simiduia sp. 21SJ11W-1]UTA47660.1 chemotaxis protein CheW [Simiduia sp. 21SJ11W-1]